MVGARYPQTHNGGTHGGGLRIAQGSMEKRTGRGMDEKAPYKNQNQKYV